MENKLITAIDQIFHPRSIAIIGASDKQNSFGRMFLETFIETGFEKIYPVNPRAEEILERLSYPSVKYIPDEVDLALILTPAETVPNVMKECVEKGVKGAIVLTAGFGEKDAEGKELEQAIVQIAHSGNTRIIGPNCIGIYYPAYKLAHFPGLPLESGSVAMISHSGSLSFFVPRIASKKGIKFSKVISCGNECDLNAADFLEYFGQDEETQIIVAYLEGMKEGKRFYQLAREISPYKPIIIWKGGLTEFGARAAASHTGALAGSNLIWQALLSQTGVISVESFEELLDCLTAFYYLPLPNGKRVAIIVGQGGPGVASVDTCIEMGLEPAQLSLPTRKALAEIVTRAGTSLANPIDMGMGSMFTPEAYQQAIGLLARDENVDLLLVIRGYSPYLITSVFEETLATVKKPSALVFLGAFEGEIFSARGIPIYSDPRRAIVALAKLAQYSEFRRQALLIK
jgi:acyl-CoA synthetase (NDP forming)